MRVFWPGGGGGEEGLLEGNGSLFLLQRKRVAREPIGRPSVKLHQQPKALMEEPVNQARCVCLIDTNEDNVTTQRPS